MTGADVGHVLPRRRRCGSVISNAERGWRKGDGEIRGGFLSRKPRYWNDQPPKAVPRPLHFANYALTMRAPDTPQIPFLSRILASRITCSLRGVIDVRVDSDKLCRSSSPFDLRLSRLLIFFFFLFLRCRLWIIKLERCFERYLNKFYEIWNFLFIRIRFVTDELTYLDVLYIYIYIYKCWRLELTLLTGKLSSVLYNIQSRHLLIDRWRMNI